MKVEHAFGAAKSSCTGRTHSTGEAQRRLQRPFFKQSGNKAGVEGISRARFIDAVYLISAGADDLIAVTGQRAALTHSDYHHTVRIQPAQDFGLVARVSPSGQSPCLVVVGEKGVRVM